MIHKMKKNLIWEKFLRDNSNVLDLRNVVQLADNVMLLAEYFEYQWKKFIHIFVYSKVGYKFRRSSTLLNGDFHNSS